MSLTVGGTSVGTLAAGASHTQYVPDNFVGSVVTDYGVAAGTPTDKVGRLDVGFAMQACFLLQMARYHTRRH